MFKTSLQFKKNGACLFQVPIYLGILHLSWQPYFGTVPAFPVLILFFSSPPTLLRRPPGVLVEEGLGTMGHTLVNFPFVHRSGSYPRSSEVLREG